MSSIDEIMIKDEIPVAFKTLFHGRKITGLEFRKLFNSMTHQDVSTVSFVKEMNDLGVILFCAGGSFVYVFTKTHLFEYWGIEIGWDIVNKPAKYDDSDIWICNGGELTEVIPLRDIVGIEVGEGDHFYSWEATTVTKDKNPIKGAIIGGAIAGTTGAVVGAIANSGKKVVTVIPSGAFITKDVKIRLTVKGLFEYDESELDEKEMAAFHATKELGDKDFIIDNCEYCNKINYALSGGFSFSGSDVNNGTAASRITSILSEYIEASKKAKLYLEEARNYWKTHREEKPALINIIRFLQKEYTANQEEINAATVEINSYVRVKRTEIEEKKKQLEDQLRSAGFFKRGGIKNEIYELQFKLNNCVAEKPFDNIMAGKIKDLEKLKEKGQKIESLITGFKNLEKDISSPKQQELLDIVLHPDVHPLEELL